jgi:biotin operon repressor
MAIFQKLSGGPVAVNELARGMDVGRPAVSQHLRVLKDAGLVVDSKDGTRRLYQLNPEGIARLRAHFDQVWDKAMSSFQTAVEHSPKNTVEQTPNTAVEPIPSEQIPSGESHDKNRRRSRRP